MKLLFNLEVVEGNRIKARAEGRKQNDPEN